jgi:predicted ATPase/DNA-binding XRE family transcriptional regulator
MRGTVLDGDAALRFGELLRQHRLRLGLTQAELAERAMLSERTISDLERGLKLPQSANARRLARALQLSPELAEQLNASRQRERLTAERRTVTPRPLPGHALPVPRSTFIGRERELAEAERLLESSRLLTLLGPGGTGKTRVALKLADAVGARYTDGAWFVSLAPVSDPHLVVPTIAQVLTLSDDGRRSPLEVLARALQQREVLLILDNFEQVLDAAPDIGQLLGVCPGVRVLATSRAPLRIAGEQELAVPPLDQHEAVWLFVERARAVKADFALTASNAAAVAELCRQLDGLPLAIELAAARTRLIDPDTMLQRFDRRLPLLTTGDRDAPPRQRTLRDTIAWSYDLLDSGDQTLFYQLSVFVGGCSLEAARAISGLSTETVFDRIDSLAANSLLRPAPTDSGEVRVTLLETVREFGLERLAARGELPAARARHAAYFLEMAERAEPGLNGAEAGAWIDRLQRDHDNLRAALDWALSQADAAPLGDVSRQADAAQQRDVALRLAGALGRFWWMAGYFGEGGRWLARALSSSGPHADPAARMKALLSAGWLAHVQRDSATATRLLEESLALARARDNAWWQAWALHALGRVAYFDNDAARATELGQRTLRLAEALGDEWLSGWALHLLGLAAYIAGEYRTAEAYYERCLTVRRELGHLEGLFIVLHLKGVAVYRLGRVAETLELVREALDIARELNSIWFYTCLLPIFAGLAAERQPRRAARLGGAVIAVSESAQTLPIPITEAFFEEKMRVAREKLGEEEFSAAWAQGLALSLESALAEAIAVEI